MNVLAKYVFLSILVGCSVLLVFGVGYWQLIIAFIAYAACVFNIPDDAFIPM